MAKSCARSWFDATFSVLIIAKVCKLSFDFIGLEVVYRMLG